MFRRMLKSWGKAFRLTNSQAKIPLDMCALFYEETTKVEVVENKNFCWVNALSSEQRLNIINYTWNVFNYSQLVFVLSVFPRTHDCSLLFVADFAINVAIFKISKDLEHDTFHSYQGYCWFKNLTHFLSLAYTTTLSLCARWKRNRSHLECD